MHSNIGSLIWAILPAITKTKNAKGGSVDNAVREDMRLNVEIIKNQSHALETMIDDGQLSTTEAYYDLDTGKVKFSPLH